MSKRGHGDGGLDERGPNKWRLRYRVNGKRVSVALTGTKTEARAKLRSLLDAASKGEHVDPSKITIGEWIDQWLAAGAPGRKKKRVSQRTLERYGRLLLTHVKPVLGARPLQQLKAAEIDKLYAAIAASAEIAPPDTASRPRRFRFTIGNCSSQGIDSRQSYASRRTDPESGGANIRE
jgi:integrase